MTLARPNPQSRDITTTRTVEKENRQIDLRTDAPTYRDLKRMTTNPWRYIRTDRPLELHEPNIYERRKPSRLAGYGIKW